MARKTSSAIRLLGKGPKTRMVDGRWSMVDSEIVARAKWGRGKGSSVDRDIEVGFVVFPDTVVGWAVSADELRPRGGGL